MSDPNATSDAAPEALDAPGVAAHAEEPLPPRKLRLVATVGILLVAIDQITKSMAVRGLANGPRDVFWTLRLNLLKNTGVAFSQGSGKGLGPWISLLALGVVVGVSLGATSRFKLGAVASGLIAGGAIGNLADRAFRSSDGFLHGAVIDFIDLQWWPVFNVADAAIVVGAGLLVVASFRMPR